MNFLVPGDILARLLVVAGGRLDADEIGEIVHRIKAERTDIVMRYDEPAVPDDLVAAVPPAKPE